MSLSLLLLMSLSSLSCSGPWAIGSVWSGPDGPHKVPPAVCGGPKTPGELVCHPNIQDRHRHPSWNRCDCHDLPCDTIGTIWDGWGQLGRSLKGFLCILPNQLGCRAPHFYRFVLFEPTLSTASLSSPSPQGSTWEAQGGDIPSTTPSHSKDKARSVDIRSKFQSVQSFNPFKVELKRLDFIQLASPPLVAALPIPTHKDV